VRPSFSNESDPARAAQSHEQAKFDGQVGFGVKVEVDLYGLWSSNIGEVVLVQMRTNLPWRSSR